MTRTAITAAALLASALVPPTGIAQPAADCSALATLRSAGLEITAATPVLPSPAWSPPASLGRPAAVAVPFCRVEGRLQGRIGFELWLPPASAWNGRLLGAGVGGDAGVYNFVDLARGVTAGYAAVTNDSGHKVTETHWMMRRDAVLDYTHRAQHFMNQAARRLVTAYYGSPAHHTYFMGCSGGGRQALKNMQRFPADYDGIIAGAGAPAMPIMSARHLWQALYQQRNPAGAMSEAHWQTVARAAVKACDADDGLVDGIVGNPARCDFRPASLACPAGSTHDCLTPAQVATVQAFMQPLRDEHGRQLDNGLLPGVSTRPGPPSPLLLPLFAQGARGDLAWTADRFHMAGDLALVQQRMPEMAADEADLAPFVARGGKAILYQGWLDPSVIAGQTLDYHAKVQRTLGASRTDDFMRLYMAPGVLHCRGGEGVDQFGNAGSTLPIGDARHDLLTALVHWVERSEPPQAIIGSKVVDGQVTRQRPLCPHPQEARYVGGPPEQAGSYRCDVPPPTRIDGRHAGGARWAIDMPAAWNGTLLLWSRGYGSGPPDQAPETAARGMRDSLLQQGYALAASNYSGREWALQEAPGDQLEVLDAFEQRFGKARRTIAWGTSMGGLVSVNLAERAASRLHGALPLCGSVSGSVGMLNTALDGAFAFRTLLAPESDIRVVNVDDDRVNSQRAEAVLAEAWQTPQGRARVLLSAALAQLPTWTDPAAAEPGPKDFAAQAEEIRKSFVRGVFVPRTDQERRAGGLYSWNTGIDYAAQLQRSGRMALVRHHYAQAGLDLDADLARLAAAPRIAASPAAIAYMRANYVPTGTPGVPTLLMQTTGDGLTVPATHGSYARAVREAGRSRMLGQLWLRGAGHCSFTPAELTAALRTLEHRLDTGRWSLSPAIVTARGTGLPGGTRFVTHREPPLLRHCGATPGSCPGEPR